MKLDSVYKMGRTEVEASTLNSSLLYEVCLKSNETGAIKFFINN